MVNLVTETPLSCSGAAKLFGVHRRTVEAWFAAGLEHCRIQGRLYTTREAIARFAEYPSEKPLVVPTAWGAEGRRQRAERDRQYREAFGV